MPRATYRGRHINIKREKFDKPANCFVEIDHKWYRLTKGGDNKKKVNEKEEGRRVVNIYGEKEHLDKEYGKEGIRWVGVSNEKIGESNSRKCNMAFALCNVLLIGVCVYTLYSLLRHE